MTMASLTTRPAAWVLAGALLTAGCAGSNEWSAHDAEQRIALGDLETASIPAQSGLNVYPVETGIAAWDGDMSATEFTAAHPSLPIGSHARVTNARTGQSAMVQITERLSNPRGRAIELSRPATAAIGAEADGVATVFVEASQHLSRGSAARLAAAAAAPRSYDRAGYTAASYGAIETSATADPVTLAYDRSTRRFASDADTAAIETGSLGAATPSYQSQTYGAQGYAPSQTGSVVRNDAAARGLSVSGARYLQLGSFRNPVYAQRLVERLEAEGMSGGAYGAAFVKQAVVGGSVYHRVRIGPMISQYQAERALRDANALRHEGARIVRQ